MKVKVGELFAKWFGAGQPETMEITDSAALASAEDAAKAGEMAIENSRGVLLSALVPAPPLAITARVKELEQQLKAAEDRLAAQAKAAEDSLATQAEAWFASVLKAEKVTPAEKDAMVAAFLDFARADATGTPDALASLGGRLGMFKAGIDARKPHGLTKESVPSDPAAISAELRAKGLRVMDNAAPAPEEAQAAERAKRVNAMLAATEAGADLAGK